MKTLVAYDSVFGNTKKIAETVAAGLGTSPATVAVPIGSIDPVAAAVDDLIVIGSPTRAFKPTPAAALGLSRLLAAAAEQGEGIKPRFAVFDTRMDTAQVNVAIFTFMTKIFHYAADALVKTISKAGGKMAAEAEWFYVVGREGPLKDGEVERARAWGQALAAKSIRP